MPLLRPTDLPIAYAGEPGAFAEDAVLAFFGDCPRRAVASFREVFETVERGAADAGVVPIENLVNGTVRENYDLLLEHDLRIAGEVIVPVRLCLAALPGERLEQIERVYSHIQALGQAEAFLRSRPWTLLTTYNTAGAGKLIADRQERRAAAVLSPRAAALFGLTVLAPDIASVPDNRTRFVVLARPGAADATRAVAVQRAAGAVEGPAGAVEGPAGAVQRAAGAVQRAAGAVEGPAGGPEGAAGTMDQTRRTTDRTAGTTDRAAGAVPRAMRTTIAFAVRNRPGTLLAALRCFADRGVNLSKLESRPLGERAWEYVFWADLDADAAEPAASAALDELRGHATLVRVLGSYPRAADGPG